MNVSDFIYAWGSGVQNIHEITNHWFHVLQIIFDLIRQRLPVGSSFFNCLQDSDGFNDETMKAEDSTELLKQLSVYSSRLAELEEEVNGRSRWSLFYN